MTYTWSFTTYDRALTARGKKCYRGPMVAVEQRLHSSFTKLVTLEWLRKRCLSDLVNSELPAVQSREIVLRCLNNPVGAMFPELRNRKKELTTRICEKRGSIELDVLFSDYYPFFLASIPEFRKYGLPLQHEALLRGALTSNSAIQRVAGVCAMLLMAAYVEQAQ